MDGSCTAEVTTMLDAVSSYTGPNVMGELGKTIRILQACSLIPGFVDVYAGDANLIPHHGEKILKVCHSERLSFIYCHLILFLVDS